VVGGDTRTLVHFVNSPYLHVFGRLKHKELIL
jgi:hypothetical protein